MEPNHALGFEVGKGALLEIIHSRGMWLVSAGNKPRGLILMGACDGPACAHMKGFCRSSGASQAGSSSCWPGSLPMGPFCRMPDASSVSLWQMA